MKNILKNLIFNKFILKNIIRIININLDIFNNIINFNIGYFNI